MARITYDDDTAEAYKAVREIPRDGLEHWRDALRRHLNPAAGTTMVDIGAGTGAFSATFREWFGLEMIAVEPSAAMRAQIPGRPGIRVLEGDAGHLPLPDASADGAWLSTVLHHIPDLDAAAREMRRVLRPGAPVLIRQVFPDRADCADTWWVHHWFPETTRVIETWPSAERTRRAFAAAGFGEHSVERIPETYWGSLAGFLAQADTFRRADSPMRVLTDEEYQRDKERLGQAAADEEAAPGPRSRTSLIDLLVLR
jgi:ubiquinone/menaquinone biosynthesis C-methylase UbiE